MGIKITKNTLGRFESKIEGQRIGDIADRIATALAERGVEIAQDNFGGESIEVSKTEATNGRASIIAKGDQVAYIEFGTGIKGKGTYPDESKLPKEPLEFESRGTRQRTEGWEYNYFKKQHPENRNLPDWTGHQAFAPMFRTGQQLRQEKGDIVKKVIKGEGVK